MRQERCFSPQTLKSVLGPVFFGFLLCNGGREMGLRFLEAKVRASPFNIFTREIVICLRRAFLSSVTKGGSVPHSKNLHGSPLSFLNNFRKIPTRPRIPRSQRTDTSLGCLCNTAPSTKSVKVPLDNQEVERPHSMKWIHTWMASLSEREGEPFRL